MQGGMRSDGDRLEKKELEERNNPSVLNLGVKCFGVRDFNFF